MVDSKKSNSLEIRREKWLRQLMADPKIEHGALKVALAIGFHFNRSKGGMAWPGTNTIADIAHIGRMTVFRAVRKLEEHGHLQVTRTRKGRRNLPNRYMPLLKRAADNRNDHVTLRDEVRLPSTIAVRPPSTIAVIPEPYTEPLTEPHIPIRISTTSGDVAVHKKSQQGKEERGIRGSEGARAPAFIESPLLPERQSITSECYRLARDNAGDRGAALVTKALQSSDPRDVLAEIESAIESGDDLGHVLWRP